MAIFVEFYEDEIIFEVDIGTPNIQFNVTEEPVIQFDTSPEQEIDIDTAPEIEIIFEVNQDPEIIFDVPIAIQGNDGGQGKRGYDGNSSVVLVAGEDINKNQVVLFYDAEALLADSSNTALVELGIGVALANVNNGNIGEYFTGGELEDAGWSWIANQEIYVGANGDLTQTPVTSGVVYIVGYAISSTKINICPQFKYLVTESGSTPNHEVTWKVRTPDGADIIMATYID